MFDFLFAFVSILFGVIKQVRGSIEEMVGRGCFIREYIERG